MVRPIEIADQILKQNNSIAGSVPLEDIATAAGIQEIQYAELKSFEGTLIANDSKTEGIIVINAGARHHRQRFTLGHELGHFMIPRHGHNMRCSSADMAVRSSKMMTAHAEMEAEANQFSAELLMPRRLLREFGFLSKEPSINDIKTAADRLDVSFQAMAVRFVDLHDYPITFVMSRNGKVEFGYKRDDFPFWLRVGRKGNLVPPKSHTGMTDHTQEETINNDECFSSLWFDENKDCELPENLIEEVYIQRDGYVATILWFEGEIEER